MPAVDHLLRATARAEARHFWFRGFRWFVEPLIREAVGARSDVRIVDCGCGTGANLDLLSRFGVSYGFDRSAVGLYLGRESGRKRLVRASVTAAPFPTGAFDLVTSFDVLYSLEEPDERAAIAEMYRLAKPGGFVLINVARWRCCAAITRCSATKSAGTIAHAFGAWSKRGFDVVRLTHTTCCSSRRCSSRACFTGGAACGRRMPRSRKSACRRTGERLLSAALPRKPLAARFQQPRRRLTAVPYAKNSAE